MSAQIQLPVEIYDFIVDQIHDDPPSLMQCSLVCRRFAHQSQQHLFRRIVLHRPSKMFKNNIVSVYYPAEKFLDAINHSPRLCELVKELEISDDREMFFYREHKSWIRKDRAIARILPMLGTLEELIIEGHQTGSRLNFLSWREDLQSAIIAKVTSLRRLSLSLMQVPLVLLYDTPNLEALTLREVRFGSTRLWTGPIYSTKSTNLRKFEFVSIYHGDWLSLYTWLQSGRDSSIDMTHITDLTLFIDIPIERPSEFLHTMSWLLHGCAQNLKHLRLLYSETGEFCASSLNSIS